MGFGSLIFMEIIPKVLKDKILSRFHGFYENDFLGWIFSWVFKKMGLFDGKRISRFESSYLVYGYGVFTSRTMELVCTVNHFT